MSPLTDLTCSAARDVGEVTSPLTLRRRYRGLDGREFTSPLTLAKLMSPSLAPCSR